ncbi:MAG: GrpB family protein [Minisyncoccia bacterium]|jgi:GrpB-like predicted nucleotidyltransferase (UPF0157 family)
MEKKDRPYSVVPYNPNWVARFEEEKRILADVFKTKAISIEHIGSTSIPGIWAKPQIDILITVKNLNDVDDAIVREMESKGYNYQPDFFTEFNEKYFTRDLPSRERTVSIHILEKNDPKTLAHIYFRDYLRTHPKERDLYSEAKKGAYQDKVNRVEYSGRKKKILRELIEKSREWAERRRS